MPTSFKLSCPSCRREHEFSTELWRCRCGSPLDLRLEGHCFNPEGWGVWRYRSMLPLLDERHTISLGEGSTPLVVRELYGLRVLLELEFLNPTGSFKDRGATVMVSNLRAAGARSLVIDSSGNAGIAVAAYSAAAGLRCRVYVPASAPREKKLQLVAYGAELVEVEGPRSAVQERTLAELREGEAYASHMWSPLFIEGLKTIAYEVFEQWGVPDAVAVPVGSGGLLLGVYWGFLALKELGLAERVPRVIAAQAAGYTSVYDALYGPYDAEPPSEPLADGIAISNSPRLRQVVEAVRASRGSAVVVRDSEIVDALRELARGGLLVEPTSATAVAALRQAREEGLVESGERVLVPLTGSGLKALDRLASKAI